MITDITTPLSFSAVREAEGLAAVSTNRPVICVQGLGFVGIAMAVAVADAKDVHGEPCFNVIGVDLPTQEGLSKAEEINTGVLPLSVMDERLGEAFAAAMQRGNLVATTNARAFSAAEVVVVDINLDVVWRDNRPSADFLPLQKAVQTLGSHMRPGALVLIETTVPPGTCMKIVRPALSRTLRERGLPEDAILLAHSYERVMPGSQYLNSIINFWRVYAGETPLAADACERFLSRVINIRDYPLTRLESTTATEIAKVLENSYRAVNIAFIEEWARFSERVGVDMFSVLEAIRMRPTHANIRQPGFGVGGYCLSKDPLFGEIAARDLFGLDNLHFEFSNLAINVNNRMPLVSLDRLRTLLGALQGKRILLLGVSYRQDIGDTRYSPSEIFVRHAEQEGAVVACHDPLVKWWQELDRTVLGELPSPQDYDAIVFAVSHRQYQELDLGRWLATANTVIFDANNVLTNTQRQALSQLQVCHASIGRGG